MTLPTAGESCMYPKVLKALLSQPRETQGSRGSDAAAGDVLLKWPLTIMFPTQQRMPARISPTALHNCAEGRGLDSLADLRKRLGNRVFILAYWHARSEARRAKRNSLASKRLCEHPEAKFQCPLLTLIRNGQTRDPG